MDALGSHFLALRQIKQLPQGVLGAFSMLADNAKTVAAPADLDIEARLQQTQVLIQRAAQVREPRVVRRLEIEFPL